MAYLPTPQTCKNNCGAMIYFDKTSAVGHPEADKWIPLVYEKETGVYTGEAHNCPNRPKYASNNGLISQKQQQQTQQVPVTLDVINSKLDRIISLVEKK